MEHLLFVCSRNQWRSPTAEKVFKQKGYNTRSAGTSPNARHTVSIKDIQWADVIFVMEKKHKNRIVAMFNRAVEHTPIHVLDIPDEYRYMDAELIDFLEDTVSVYLD